MRIVHSVLLDECAGLVLAADRERGRVQSWSLADLKPRSSWDLLKRGKVKPYMPYLPKTQKVNLLSYMSSPMSTTRQ